MMLQLQIGFPSRRCHAASHADPHQPEWPPHPSRVFSALVAAAYGTSGHLADQDRFALDRLAAAGAPWLACPDADTRAAPDSYVPVNDEHTRLDPRHSHGVLEAGRQPRQFPASFLLADQPELVLGWSLAEAPPELDTLDAIAARMTHLGTSHTPVCARFVWAPPLAPARWLPQEASEPHLGETRFLRITLPGRLAELDARFALATSTSVTGLAPRGRRAGAPGDALRRHVPLCEAPWPYRAADADVRPHHAARHDWIALQLSGASWGADTSHTLARAARRALMSLLGDSVPAALHGHDPDIDHLAWLPLPDVGHRHAAGRIRGLAVGMPRHMAATEQAVLLRGLLRLQWLHLPDGQVARLQPVEEEMDTPGLLRARTWCGAATDWATVTPVVLDRPPRRAQAQAIVASMVESLQRAGLPRPLEVRVSSDSLFEGAPPARTVPTQLPRFHARVRFPVPVEGPVIAGRWRHFGIGLFRPVVRQGEPTQ